jgi:hypothetical protein
MVCYTRDAKGATTIVEELIGTMLECIMEKLGSNTKLILWINELDASNAVINTVIFIDSDTTQHAYNIIGDKYIESEYRVDIMNQSIQGCNLDIVIYGTDIGEMPDIIYDIVYPMIPTNTRDLFVSKYWMPSIFELNESDMELSINKARDIYVERDGIWIAGSLARTMMEEQYE